MVRSQTSVWRKGHQERCFEKIAEAFTKESGRRVTGEQCLRKWGKIVSKQKEIEDYNNKSGNSIKSWKFYEELAHCLAKDATVKPVYTMESSLHLEQSCPILPHCYGPLRAVNGPYVLHKPSLLLTVLC